MNSGRTGCYRWEKDGRGIRGVPPDEPIWLESIMPQIVWTRVVPAVVAFNSKKHPTADDLSVLDITDWVLSDKGPADLPKSRPSHGKVGVRHQPWQW